MLTNRDIDIIRKIEDFKLLSSSQIQRLFNMNQPKVSKRMNIIVRDIKDIKCSRYNPTNNFYNDKYMKIFKNIEDIDTEWVKSKEKVDYKYNNEFSPINIIKEIEVLERK